LAQNSLCPQRTLLADDERLYPKPS
jgi:hypothetical protein